MIASALQHCVIPIHSGTNHGTIFFPTPGWGLTAAHAVDFVTEEHAFTISVDGSDTGLRLKMAAPEGALDPDRPAELDWAVLRTQGDAGPFGGCGLTLAPEHQPAIGDAVFPVGLLWADFEAYEEKNELRAFQLEVSGPMPGASARDDVIWMRWPFEVAPNGFSGGPVFAMVDGELAVVGITILAIFQGDDAWLVARRVDDEVIAFAESD